jgi:hypothetical protein
VDARHKAGHDEEIVPLNIVIASEAKQSKPSFRDGAKRQTRNLEIPGSMLRIAPE